MPARLTRIVSAAEKFEITVEKPKRGSHWKAKKPGCRTYTLPAHNGKKTEISDQYIRAFCRHFGLNEDEFRAEL